MYLMRAEMEQAVAESKIEKDPTETQPVNMHLEEHFKSYVQERYIVDSPSTLENPQIMQMIFALEWFDVPRDAYADLIEFHPDLTVADQERLHYILFQHRIENSISMALFSMLSNRYLKSKGPQLMQKRFARLPCAALIGGTFTYLMNHFVLRTIMLNDMEEIGLKNKYFELDLNADMMRDDLEGLGIRIEAKHFDMEQAQARADAKYQQEQQQKDYTDKKL